MFPIPEVVAAEVIASRTPQYVNPDLKDRELTRRNITEDSIKAANAMLDYISKHLGLKNDAHLSRFLGMRPSVVCKMRTGMLRVSPETLITLHERTYLPMHYLIDLVEGKTS